MAFFFFFFSFFAMVSPNTNLVYFAADMIKLCAKKTLIGFQRTYNNSYIFESVCLLYPSKLGHLFTFNTRKRERSPDLLYMMLSLKKCVLREYALNPKP